MERAKPSTKRKAPAFKPPLPASEKSQSSTKVVRRKSAPAKPQPISSDSSSDEEQSSQSPEAKSEDPSLKIPPKLLTKLLHHHFEHEQTRIGQDANALVGKYMETFVREALARAAYERSKAEGGAAGKDFLEVSEGKAVCELTS